MIADLLGKDKLRIIHEHNLHKLLVKIYKSTFQITPSIMYNFFDLMRNRYNFRGNCFLKLPDKHPSTMFQRKSPVE